MSIIISNYLNKKQALKKHLNDFGLIFFNNEYDYNNWAQEKIINSNISKYDKNKYLYYISTNNTKKPYCLNIAFYNLVSKYLDLSVVLHSMKAEDILVSGSSVSKHLSDSSDILDLGCNVGYLSSFYSKLFKNSKVTGFDASQNSIRLAKKIYNKDIYKNLYFSSNYTFIKEKKFDYILDTQCLCSLSRNELSKITIKISKILKTSGKIISISSLSNESKAHNFINNFSKNNLYVESISDVFVNTIYGIRAYTKIIITKKKINHIIQIENYYKKLRVKMSLLNFFNTF